MSSESPRLDPRVLRTRLLIRDAFIDLLQEIELEKITVHRLTERATINRVTFYLHYRDIPDMLEKMADDMYNVIKSVLHEELSESKRSSETRLVKMLEHFAENSKLYKVLLSSKRIPIFTERFLTLMIDEISGKIDKQGAFHSAKDVPKDILLWYSSSAFIGTIISWLRNDMIYSPAFLAKKLLILAPFATSERENADPKS